MEAKLPTPRPPALLSAGDNILPADPEIADDPVHVPHERAARATSLTPFPLQFYPWVCLL